MSQGFPVGPGKNKPELVLTEGFKRHHAAMVCCQENVLAWHWKEKYVISSGSAP